MNDVFLEKKYYFLVQTAFRTIFLLFIVIRAPNRAPATGARRRAPESRPARGYPALTWPTAKAKNNQQTPIEKNTNANFFKLFLMCCTFDSSS